MENTYWVNKEDYAEGKPIHIVLSEEVSFLNKASIITTLDAIPKNSTVIIDGSRSTYIDYDVLEVINDFKDNANYKNIKVEVINIKEVYRFGKH